MNQQMEIAVIIEKEIHGLNSHEKINQFIISCNFYHLSRCEVKDNCLNCRFILNITYLYLENLSDYKTGVEKLQKYCKLYFDNFFQ